MNLSNHELAIRYDKKSKLINKGKIKYRLLENDGVELLYVLDEDTSGIIVIPPFITSIGYRNTKYGKIKAPLLGCNYSEVYIDNKYDIDISGLCSYMDSRELKMMSSKPDGIIGVERLIKGSKNLISIDLGNISSINAASISGLFASCSKLVEVKGLSKLDTSNVKDMSDVFNGCKELTCIDGIGSWNTKNVIDMREAFSETKIKDVDALSKWDTSKVTNMICMFNDCNKLMGISGLVNWDVQNVISMEYMFSGCVKLMDIKALSGWDIRRVNSLSGMFNESGILDLLALSNWDTRNVKNIYDMFNGCYRLVSLSGIDRFNVKNVKSLEGIFSFCSNLKDISAISGWDVTNIESIDNMLTYCGNLEDILSISSWRLINIKSIRDVIKDSYKISKDIEYELLSEWEKRSEKVKILKECGVIKMR